VQRRYTVHGPAYALTVVEEKVRQLTRGRASSRAQVDILRAWEADVTEHDSGVVLEAASPGWLGFVNLGKIPDDDVVVDVTEPLDGTAVEPAVNVA